MGDDIGWMQPSIYHRGLVVGETPERAGLYQTKNELVGFLGIIAIKKIDDLGRDFLIVS